MIDFDSPRAPSLVEEVGSVLHNIRAPKPDEPPCELCLAAAKDAIAVVLRRMEEPSGGMVAGAVGTKATSALLAKAIWAAMLAAFRKENGVE